MFKKRGLILVALSLIMGVGAAWVANNWILKGTQTDEVNKAQVATAAMRIPYGTKIASRHVNFVNMPDGSIPIDAMRTIEEIEGKVATADILPGEFLLNARFADHTGGSTLASLVEENMRAITVRVDDVIGVAGFLLPGNMVDVLASRLERGSRRAITETILKRVKVLAVDQTAKTNENDPVVVRAVTLEVTPKQAEVLVARAEEGSLQLTLLNPKDEALPEPVKATPKAVVRRAPPPSTDTTITIIKGTTVKKTKVKI